MSVGSVVKFERIVPMSENLPPRTYDTDSTKREKFGKPPMSADSHVS